MILKDVKGILRSFFEFKEILKEYSGSLKEFSRILEEFQGSLRKFQES